MAPKRKTATAATTDVDRARELILWARSEGVALAEIQVGDVRAVLSDTKLAGVVTPRTDEESRANLYRQFGGAALAEAVREDTDSAFLEDSD